MKALVGAFNQEKALVGAFSVIVKPVVEPMEHHTALFQVPGDMCWDKEDGGTRDLNLQLLTLARLEVDSDNWLQFDVKNQEFVGVPLENDVGREEYQLVCSDNEGYSSIDGIEVSGDIQYSPH